MGGLRLDEMAGLGMEEREQAGSLPETERGEAALPVQQEVADASARVPLPDLAGEGTAEEGVVA